MKQYIDFIVIETNVVESSHLLIINSMEDGDGGDGGVGGYIKTPTSLPSTMDYYYCCYLDKESRYYYTAQTININIILVLFIR